MAISLHSVATSDPLYPSVSFATHPRLTAASRLCGPSKFVVIAALASSLGKPTSTRFSSLRSMARSSSHGKFVAHSTKTPLAVSGDARPSIWINSSVFMRREASCSPPPPPPPPRADINASISSMNTVDGA